MKRGPLLFALYILMGAGAAGINHAVGDDATFAFIIGIPVVIAISVAFGRINWIGAVLLYSISCAFTAIQLIYG